ncbi:M50 family metallopeptidase [Aquipuribacter nitratireducens]|uniref:M50 family metallopeptidase n=1 Tax=Aquipuribacter nitratireducens TaxID=650104 RepID=A0ABW0GK15_9MICO
MTDALREIWSDALTAAAPPGLVVVLVVAGVALALAQVPLVRQAVTVVHEAGHAVVAVCVGRRVSGIRLHADASGVTLSRGRPSGPGMVATLLAGYPAPSVVGVAGAAAVAAGYAAGLLWALVLAATVLVLAVGNLYGLLVLLALGGAVAAASWFLPPTVVGWVALLLVWTLLLTAPRTVLELFGGSARRDPRSDPAQLASVTGVPRLLWLLLLLAVTVGGAVLGAVLLLP